MGEMMPLIMVAGAGTLVLAMLAMAFSGPSTAKNQARRLTALRDRHSGSTIAVVDAQMRRITAARSTKMDGLAGRLLPNPALLKKRLDMTGKNWTPGKYLIASLVLLVITATVLKLRGAPILLCLFGGLAVGLMIPHMVVKRTIGKRIAAFTKRFPDAIELLVRGLRSGLPISETLGIVATELPGPVGAEFRMIGDKIKIGRTMDAALQDTADRLGTPEFQFFTISLQIQRETGGNLAETLSNLAEVLRKRAQMKLKIAAMSSESKASAYIIGSLPFIVFALIMFISPDYMGKFFIDQRLIVAGLGGMVWMSIGAFIMKQMINFEI